VPNKRDPNRDIDDFLADLKNIQGRWIATFDVLREADLPSDARERLLKESCVDAFLRAAVSFEGFRSDWHITAIHRKSRKFTARLEERFRSRLQGDDALKGASAYASMRIPGHLSLSATRRLADPVGRNISLKSSGKRTWADRAAAELEEPFCSAVRSLPSADWKLMTAIDAVRNHLAHRSLDSVEHMNSALTALDATRDPGLRAGGTYRVRTGGVPRYLWAYAEGNDGLCRLVVYYDRMRDIVNALRV
jgi:hypothetical protein